MERAVTKRHLNHMLTSPLRLLLIAVMGHLPFSKFTVYLDGKNKLTGVYDNLFQFLSSSQMVVVRMWCHKELLRERFSSLKITGTDSREVVFKFSNETFSC